MLTVPMILFILPTLFIVLLGPAGISIVDTFSKKNPNAPSTTSAGQVRAAGSHRARCADPRRTLATARPRLARIPRSGQRARDRAALRMAGPICLRPERLDRPMPRLRRQLAQAFVIGEIALHRCRVEIEPRHLLGRPAGRLAARRSAPASAAPAATRSAPSRSGAGSPIASGVISGQRQRQRQIERQRRVSGRQLEAAPVARLRLFVPADEIIGDADQLQQLGIVRGVLIGDRRAAGRQARACRSSGRRGRDRATRRGSRASRASAAL